MCVRSVCPLYLPNLVRVSMLRVYTEVKYYGFIPYSYARVICKNKKSRTKAVKYYFMHTPFPRI